MKPDRMQARLELARALIKRGDTNTEVARQCERSIAWVRKYLADELEERRLERQSRSQTKPDGRKTKPAPRGYKPVPSGELPDIRTGKDELDALAWWRGARA